MIQVRYFQIQMFNGYLNENIFSTNAMREFMIITTRQPPPPVTTTIK